MEVPKNIFRDYDIRGIYPQEINAETSLHVGKALGSLIVKKGKNKVVVSRDNRESSPELSEKLIQGLVSTGCHVTDIGVSITPIIHFLTCTMDFDLAINVTASHNPKQYNGFRIDYVNARSFYGDLVLMLRFLIERQDYLTGDGSVLTENLNESYIEFMKKKFHFSGKPKIVINCGGGATSVIAPRIFEETGCQVIPVNCKLDSTFPKGVPNPENDDFMEELKTHVLKNKAEVGFAYDLDGDRFGFVDEKGQTYDTDRTLLLFAEYVLKKNPQGVVIYDVKSSSLLDDVITKLGGIPKLFRTGHPYFADEVEKNAVLGAEFSGHVYFSDEYFGYDDGIYASFRLLEIMQMAKKSVSSLMAKFPVRVATNELKVDCPDNVKFKVINILKIYVINHVDYMQMIDIDGIRVKISDTGWFLIRASNTSPYLSIRVEGKDEEEKNKLLEIVREALRSISIIKLDVEI